jgi:hypothetical protein
MGRRPSQRRNGRREGGESDQLAAPTTEKTIKPVISSERVPNIFGYGLLGLGLCLGIVFVDPALAPPQVAVVAIILGLSAAAFATAIAGILKLETKYIVAGGPFAVFAIAFWAMMSVAAPNVLPSLSTPFSKSIQKSDR